ncbi:hypothetical protein L1987_57627 [Smallanthus sonchifolius]|uniref:Uncharacterized protein n=1 Tax=Smallanthus sonchifolius TaxID=185202 RepID=A0ACB9DD45_9ASTR|nr:hypothetical protein L1987_57627 [Smallanthus sonchifolius]
MGGQFSSPSPQTFGGKVVTVKSKEDWETQLQNSKTSNKLMVIDFSASWCGPSLFMDPVVQDLANEFPDVDFIKIDIDDFKDVADTFEVKAIPTFVLLKKGKERERVVGVKKDELHRVIEKLRS